MVEEGEGGWRAEHLKEQLKCESEEGTNVVDERGHATRFSHCHRLLCTRLVLVVLVGV
jgi:hypothetical protein